MSLLDFCGKVAISVSCLIVLVAVVLALLLGFCFLLGAYESATNSHVQQDTAQDLQNASAQINAGAADIAHAVPAVPGK
ncbi:hypothetical protein [Methanoregula sp.]|uniref:hypothetical protein n=1 Tax=Methanoregula sp. TaxID=2052170 RepID=UPI003BB1C603